MPTKRKKEPAYATISASSSTDLHLILLWLKSTGAISSSGKTKKIDKKYTSKVKLILSKEKTRYLAKDRFGTFVNVR